MIIKLYKNVSDPAVLGKKLQNEQSITGNFRGEVNIITPMLTLARESSPSICEINKFNYVEIPDLKRFYFVQNITISPKGLISLSLLEDVVESYKSSIRDMTCFVERSFKRYLNYMPDPMAIQRPAINVASYALSKTTSLGFRSCEDVWRDVNTENSKLCYIITFMGCEAVSRYNTGSGGIQKKYFKPQGPCLKIICTKAWYAHFVEEISDFWTSIKDHFIHMKDCIIKVETIPEVITVDDHPNGHYQTLNHHSTSQFNIPDTDLVNGIKFPFGEEEFGSNHVEASGNTPYYAFVLKDEIFETQFERSITISDDFENTQQYKKYSIQMNPFGEVELPADELLGTSKIYIKIKHSMYNGQAQLLWHSSKTATWRILAESNLNFEQPWVSSGDWANLVVSGIKTIATIALTKGALKGGESTETSIPITSTFEYTPDLSTSYNATTNSMGGVDVRQTGLQGGAQGPLNPRSTPFENPRLSYSYTKDAATQKSVSSASTTSKVLATSQNINAVMSCVDSIPAPEFKGTLKSVLIDSVPTLIVSTRYTWVPTPSIIGRVSLQEFRIGDYTGYCKVGHFTFNSFRKSNDPEPLDAELKMISNILTNGIYIAQGDLPET